SSDTTTNRNTTTQTQTTPTTGGVTTSGGATATGGGTTSGGASSVGGGTTGGAATANTLTDLQINSSRLSTAVTRSGVLSGATMGRGPAAPSASILRLRDVARIELGAQNYNQSCTFDGRPSVGLSVYQMPGTNALEVADRVRAKMEELKKRFPDG